MPKGNAVCEQSNVLSYVCFHDRGKLITILHLHTGKEGGGVTFICQHGAQHHRLAVDFHSTQLFIPNHDCLVQILTEPRSEIAANDTEDNYFIVAESNILDIYLKSKKWSGVILIWKKLYNQKLHVYM